MFVIKLEICNVGSSGCIPSIWRRLLGTRSEVSVAICTFSYLVFMFFRPGDSDLRYTRLPFSMSRVSGAQLRGFASGPTHKGINGGESLATCGKLNGSGFEPHTSRTSLSSSRRLATLSCPRYTK